MTPWCGRRWRGRGSWPPSSTRPPPPRPPRRPPPSPSRPRPRWPRPRPGGCGCSSLWSPRSGRTSGGWRRSSAAAAAWWRPPGRPWTGGGRGAASGPARRCGPPSGQTQHGKYFSEDQIFSLYCYRILTSFVARGEERPVPDNIMAAIVQLTQVTSHQSPPHTPVNYLTFSLTVHK